MRISIEKECGTGFSRPLVVQMNPVLRGEGETLPLGCWCLSLGDPVAVSGDRGLRRGLGDRVQGLGGL